MQTDAFSLLVGVLIIHFERSPALGHRDEVGAFNHGACCFSSNLASSQY